MKLRKTTFIFALLLVLICFFAACGEVSERELTLNDFVYDTEIDTDHAISDSELAAMNKVWRAEFGRDFAATTEEATQRSEQGNFYFGRYGRTFVFYRYSYEWDMDFEWNGYTFVFPRGHLYFVNGEKVYTQSEIALTDVFTPDHFGAFYDYYANTYRYFKSVISLPDGGYVITQEELDAMNLAYARKVGGKDTLKVFDTLEIATQRIKDRAYYFGKYGDTVIIWTAQHYRNNPTFTLGGYEFKFPTGCVFFFDPSGVYENDTVIGANILTDAELKAFYEDFIDHYVPLNTDPYVCSEFTDGVEMPTEAEMQEINEAYGAWKYEQIYNYYYEMYIENKYTAENADASAANAVASRIGRETHRFFNEDNFNNYQYWGNSGEKVFLATQNTHGDLTVIEVAGYKFVLDGGDCDLLVYENGKITPLAEAYEKGIVTKSEVALAHERHLEYGKYLSGGIEEIAPPARLKVVPPSRECPVKLTEAEEREIVWEYIVDDINLSREPQSTFSVRCYGKFGDVYAVMIDGPWMYTMAIRYENICGYVFYFADGQQMFIYKDGVFYSILKAYELGIISEDNVAAIEWSKTAPYTYEKITAPIELTEEDIEIIIHSEVEFGATHEKDTVYSIRCYGKNDHGCVVFIDRSDKTYEAAKTSDKVGKYEFIYPTTQRLSFMWNYSENVSLNYAFDSKLIDDAQLKVIYETYRAAYPELYK